jgi:ABC-type glutathione transport system ATPase component
MITVALIGPDGAGKTTISRIIIDHTLFEEEWRFFVEELPWQGY